MVQGDAALLSVPQPHLGELEFLLQLAFCENILQPKRTPEKEHLADEGQKLSTT